MRSHRYWLIMLAMQGAEHCMGGSIPEPLGAELVEASDVPARSSGSGKSQERDELVTCSQECIETDIQGRFFPQCPDGGASLAHIRRKPEGLGQQPHSLRHLLLALDVVHVDVGLRHEVVPLLLQRPLSCPRKCNADKEATGEVLRLHQFVLLRDRLVEPGTVPV